MILTNSRYVNSPILLVEGSDGVSRPTVYRGAVALPRQFLHYQVVLGDRMDVLAYAFFGDPTLWWLIADSNPEVFYPDNLVPGSIIRIPQAS
jgi:hypothetical protein